MADTNLLAYERRALFEGHLYDLLHQMTEQEFDRRAGDFEHWDDGLYYRLRVYDVTFQMKRPINQRRILALRHHLLDKLEEEEKHHAQLSLR